MTTIHSLLWPVQGLGNNAKSLKPSSSQPSSSLKCMSNVSIPVLLYWHLSLHGVKCKSTVTTSSSWDTSSVKLLKMKFGKKVSKKIIRLGFFNKLLSKEKMTALLEIIATKCEKRAKKGLLQPLCLETPVLTSFCNWKSSNNCRTSRALRRIAKLRKDSCSENGGTCVVCVSTL